MGGRTTSPPHSRALGKFFKADYLAQATPKRKQSSIGFLIPIRLEKALQEQMWYLPALGEGAEKFRRPALKASHALAPTLVPTFLPECSPPA